MKRHVGSRSTAIFTLLLSSCAIFFWHATSCSKYTVCFFSSSWRRSFFSSPGSTLFEKKNIEWLHIPKAGTSFGNALVRWACPSIKPKTWITPAEADVPKSCLTKFRLEHTRKKWPIGDHVSLESRTDAELKKIFTLVRSPRSRMVSGYHYLQKVIYNRKIDASAAEICKYASGNKHAHVALGAQTKIIAGVAMRAPSFVFKTATPPDLAVAQDACDRLQQFAFVGISDFWEASMCFFHAMYGGESSLDEMANVRPGNYKKDLSAMECSDCYDAADEMLFLCASKIFEGYARQYPQCLKHMSLPDIEDKSISPFEQLKSLSCPAAP